MTRGDVQTLYNLRQAESSVSSNPRNLSQTIEQRFNFISSNQGRKIHSWSYIRACAVAVSERKGGNHNLGKDQPSTEHHECKIAFPLQLIPSDDSSPDCGMGLRQAHDAGRAPAQAPAVPGEDATRIGSGEGETREPGEEADTRDQEERQEWADGSVQGPGEGPSKNKAVY
jgi:hypothetical protein